MEIGLCIDIAQGEVRQQSWQPGEVEVNKLLGLIPNGIKFDKDNALPVVTYRCPDCGWLQSYAHPVDE